MCLPLIFLNTIVVQTYPYPVPWNYSSLSISCSKSLVWSSQNLQHKFLDWKWPPPPGTFPKIHPIWRSHPSLSDKGSQWSDSGLIKIATKCSKRREEGVNSFLNNVKKKLVPHCIPIQRYDFLHSRCFTRGTTLRIGLTGCGLRRCLAATRTILSPSVTCQTFRWAQL